jgi:hypothetical protein
MATYTKKQIDEEREMLLQSVERYKEQLSADLLNNNSGSDLRMEIKETAKRSKKKSSFFNKLLKALSL